MQPFIEQLSLGRSLSEAQIAEAVDWLVQEMAPAEAKAEFLAALSAKGETADEIAAFALALRDKSITPRLFPETRSGVLMDVCGTGGDRMSTFNVSTAVALVVSAAGISVAKHGNRAITSQSGSADVLEALGIRIDLGPEEIGRWLRDHHFAFFFAPQYHPAFRHIGPARRLCAERGQRTLFNYLGPLLNPARPTAQLVGVPDPTLCPKLAQVLQKMGVQRGFVVSGRLEEGFLDEISVAGSTVLASFNCGPEIKVTQVQPRDFTERTATRADLIGGTRTRSAEIILAILRGTDHGPRRDVVQLNAGAALALAGAAADLREGWQTAGRLLDEGRALRQLEQLQAVSRTSPVPDEVS
jgi:anthranilate phosphoribosyltransferase